MTDHSQPPRFPAWLAHAVVVMLGMQLVLAWLHGSLLHRQHDDLLALREDVQYLTDALEQGMEEGYADEDYAEESLAPTGQRKIHGLRVQRVRMLQGQPEEEEQAQKDLQDARASARQAVGEAREVQSKLSISENIRKAEEKAKVESAERAWMKWVWIALGAGLVGVAVRAWLRKRG